MTRPSLAFVCLLLALLIAGASASLGLAQELDEAPPPATDAARGTGTEFIVTTPAYEFVLQSTQEITALVDPTAADGLEIFLEAGASASSTELSIAGLPPSTTLYKYEDGLGHPVALQTDAAGVLRFTQDLTTGHLVMIQGSTSTLYLDDDGWSDADGNPLNGVVGSWDPVTRQARLLQDLSETVYVTGAGITLDGNGYHCFADLTHYAVYVRADDVVVRGLQVGAAKYGIGAYSVDGVVFRDNVIEPTSGEEHLFGIRVSTCTNLQILSNVVSTTNPMFLVNLQESLIEGNDLISARFGLVIEGGATDTVIRDNQIDGYYECLKVFSLKRCEIVGNEFLGGWRTIFLYECSDNELRGNRLETTLGTGMYISRSHGNVVLNNVCTVRDRPVDLYLSTNNLIYNNDFSSSRAYPPACRDGCVDNVFALEAPTGGNYWSTYLGVDADGDGFGDTPYEFPGGVDLLPYVVESGWAHPSHVWMTGGVASDCEGALEGATVEIQHPDGLVYSTTTDPAGQYAIELPWSEDPGVVRLLVPGGFVPADPPAAEWTTSFAADTELSFLLDCVYVTVSGTVAADCAGPLQVTVDLQYGDQFRTTATDESGAYRFEGVRWSETPGEVGIVTPLGFLCEDPLDGHAAVDLTADALLPFTLRCLDATGEARGMGYWKHQVRVHLNGKGTAQESLEDMALNFPRAIFEHFYESDLNSIQVSGVSYLPTADGGECIDLATIEGTLTVNKGGTPEDRAKQHYLALLLNLASGKLMTFGVVSEEGYTASQALQEVADLINNGGEAEHVLAKDIAEMINHGTTVPAGLIRDLWTDIAYKAAPPALRARLEQNVPNPFNPSTTIHFVLPAAGPYELGIYNAAGRLVRGFRQNGQPGENQVVWDGRNHRGAPVSSGVYFYRLRAGSFEDHRKMVLSK